MKKINYFHFFQYFYIFISTKAMNITNYDIINSIIISPPLYNNKIINDHPDTIIVIIIFTIVTLIALGLVLIFLGILFYYIFYYYSGVY